MKLKYFKKFAVIFEKTESGQESHTKTRLISNSRVGKVNPLGFSLRWGMGCPPPPHQYKFPLLQILLSSIHHQIFISPTKGSSSPLNNNFHVIAQ